MTGEELLRAYEAGRRDFSRTDLRGLKLDVRGEILALDGIILRECDLRGAVLTGCSMTGADLTQAVLTGSNLLRVDFTGATLVVTTFSSFELPSRVNGCTFTGADLRSAGLGSARIFNTTFENAQMFAVTMSSAWCWGLRFKGADMTRATAMNVNFELADLREVNLQEALLKRSNMKRARLAGANLSGCDLSGVNFYSAKFDRTNFSGAKFYRTALVNVDLTEIDLHDVTHGAPSAIDHETLERTAASLGKGSGNRGQIEQFLRGCGVEEHLVDYFAAMIGRPIEFYSAFISYSHEDRSFARALHDALQGRGIRCWLDEHAMKPGDRVLDVINEAIRSCDKLLLCCSRSSLESWWVKDEIRKALERERREKRDLIVPVMLDRYLLDEWNDGLASDVRSRLAPDLAGWQSDHSLFVRGVERIVSALRTPAGTVY